MNKAIFCGNVQNYTSKHQISILVDVSKDEHVINCFMGLEFFIVLKLNCIPTARAA